MSTADVKPPAPLTGSLIAHLERVKITMPRASLPSEWIEVKWTFSNGVLAPDTVYRSARFEFKSGSGSLDMPVALKHTTDVRVRDRPCKTECRVSIKQFASRESKDEESVASATFKLSDFDQTALGASTTFQPAPDSLKSYGKQNVKFTIIMRFTSSVASENPPSNAVTPKAMRSPANGEVAREAGLLHRRGSAVPVAPPPGTTGGGPNPNAAGLSNAFRAVRWLVLPVAMALCCLSALRAYGSIAGLFFTASPSSVYCKYVLPSVQFGGGAATFGMATVSQFMPYGVLQSVAAWWAGPSAIVSLAMGPVGWAAIGLGALAGAASLSSNRFCPAPSSAVATEHLLSSLVEIAALVMMCAAVVWVYNRMFGRAVDECELRVTAQVNRMYAEVLLHAQEETQRAIEKLRVERKNQDERAAERHAANEGKQNQIFKKIACVDGKVNGIADDLKSENELVTKLVTPAVTPKATTK